MTTFNYPLHLLRALLIVVMVCNLLCAQNRGTDEAVLRVTVVDPAGATVSGARVSLARIGQAQGDQARPADSANSAGSDGHEQVSISDRRGRATFNRAAPGRYRLQVTADGFAPFSLDQVTLRSGANQIEAKLAIASVQAEIKVGQDKVEANTDLRGNAFSTVLMPEQIAELPDDPEEFETALRQIAGPGATFRVNGFRGGKLPPKNQIREIRFRTNGYAAENHESSLINVDILTKPGIEAWHGSVNFGFRDESLNARNAFALARAPEQNRRFGFDLGGPIWKNRTSLFLSADGVNSYEAKTIAAALPTGKLFSQVNQPWRTLNTTARLEHLLTPAHTARLEYQRNAGRRDNNGVGNYDLPERGYTTDSAEQLLRLADSGSIGKKLFNELRFQARWQTVEIDSLSDAVTIQVLNAFNIGGAQAHSLRRVREIEFADNLDFALRKHTMRAGILFEFANYRNDQRQNENGTFIFSGLKEYEAGTPAIYSRRAGVGTADFNQSQLGWYGQDDWRLRKNLTVSFGLRHEWQNTLKDKNNLAPRLGLAWSPTKSGKTVIRGGAGIFYDWFAADSYEQALLVNGSQQRDLVVLDPCFPNPFACATSSAPPPGRIQVDPRLELPSVWRASIELQQELPKGLRLMSQYIYSRGAHQLRGRDINAPIPGAGRPDPATGNITQIEASANSFHRAWMVNLSRMRPGRFSFGANYVYSKTTDETDGPLGLPADNYNLRAERGPSSQDIRHRFMLLSNLSLPLGLRVGSIFQANSAPPYTITTGFNDNRDSVVNDRPRGVGRNTARGAGRWDLNLRLSRSFGFGKLRDAQGRGGPQIRVVRGGDASDMLGSMGSLPGPNDRRFRTEFFIQATNLFNHVNRRDFSGVQTSPFFGQATAARPGRRIETGMRFSF